MIDLTELTGEIKVENREEFLTALFKVVRQIGDPYQMPEAMVEWLRQYNTDHKVDTYYQIPVGYSHYALALGFTFKQEMIIMQFMDPTGMRLMELRLHT